MKRRSKALFWVGVTFVALLAASIFVPAFSGVAIKGQSTKDHSDARQIAYALHVYAEDNAGHLPPALRDLVPTYITDDFNSKSGGIRLNEWHYFPNAPKDDPTAIVLVSPRIYSERKFELAPLFAPPHHFFGHYNRLAITRAGLTFTRPVESAFISESELNSRLTRQLQAMQGQPQ